MQELDRSGMDGNFVLSQLMQFTREQKLKEAIIKASELLSRGGASLADVEAVLADTLRARPLEYASGMRLSDYDRLLQFLDTQEAEFDSGIKLLDDHRIVPQRGTLFLLLAAKGKGKSWGLVHFGKRALLRRKKVLHISLEMREELVMMRYYQSLFATPRRPRDITVTHLQLQLNKLVGLRRESIAPPFDFTSKMLREELENHMERLGPRQLIIKQFPARKLTPQRLEAYLDSLKQTDGFEPDLLLLDYLGIMHTDAKNHRISLGITAEELRAIAVERNLALVTAHQVSKEGSEASLVKPQHIAEDWSIIWTADVNITLSQTTEEKRVNTARLFVGNARNEEDEFCVLITQNYAIGQFALQSMFMPVTKEYFALLDNDSQQPAEAAE
jgi:DnaB-like helicase C terminal domain